jgi:hypothetical protein
MMKKLVLLSVLILIATVAFAQEKVPLPELQHEIITLKFLDVKEISSIVEGLCSNHPEADIFYNQSNNSFLVKDTAEAIARIKATISKMDVQPHRFQIAFYLIGASKADGALPSNIPKKVMASLEQVKNAMAFNSFSLIDAGFLTFDGEGNQNSLSLGNGLTVSFRSSSYNGANRYLKLNELQLAQVSETFSKRIFETDIGIGDGEVVIAGASKIDGDDDAILVVVTMDIQ